MKNETVAEATKKCAYCQKDIPVRAIQCPFCQSEQRNWMMRHKITTVVLGIIVFMFVASASRHAAQPSTDITSSGNSITSLLTENTPNIKQINTTPKDYVGKSFVLNVNAKDARYYNYGFSDEGRYYSLTLWDSSVGGDFDGVYAYMLKTPENKALVDKALNDSVALKVHVSIPITKWVDGSNAFMQIDSWKYLNQ